MCMFVLSVCSLFEDDVSKSDSVASNDGVLNFFSLVLQTNSGLGSLHETFRFTSVTRSRTAGRTPLIGDQLVARPLPVHKHRKAHTQHKH
jgi:hypothetical protein